MADPKGFLKVTERELPARRPVPVRILDWKEVYEPGDSAVLRTRQNAVDEGLDPDGDVVWTRILEVTGG